MILPSGPQPGPSILLFEASATLIALTIAFCLPRFGSKLFTRIERAFTQLARRQNLSVVVVGLSALLLRLSILPLSPIPKPFVQDDFSFLLAANTFASDRLSNPTPAMWTHFESFQISMQPTYMSMYFPAQGLILAAGKVLFGHPWYGLLCVTALMCAAICWMLQAWLPPTWALLGGMLAVLRLGLFSYWIDTYSGGGSIAALGGALVLGALPRFMRTMQHRYILLMTLGIIILAYSRPYEGMLLCLPVLFVLARWIFFGTNRPNPAALFRRAVLPLALLVAAGAWMGYYNYRDFGSPVTLPYTVNRAAYAVAPYWIWQSPRPVPVYRHKVMRDFYLYDELGYAARLHTVSGFLSETLFFKPARIILFFCGLALLPLLLMLRRVFLDRRTRFLLVCVGIVVVGVMMETWLIPHYFAAITAAIYAIGLQAMRHLRQWKPDGKPVGLALVRLTITICIALATLRICAEPLHLQLAVWPGGGWTSEWYGPGQLGAERAHIESELEKLPGKQLIIVRYSSDHNPFDEWVYNAPDIDASKIIWAREMDTANNLDLMRYYKDRQVWLVQPDLHPSPVLTYSATTTSR
jgi:hypothetical protein